MSRATALGLEISETCEALTSTISAPARSAMNRCCASGMIRSSVPMRYQDGIVFQAGTPEGSRPALNAMGRWVAAIASASRFGRSGAKEFTTTSGFR